MTDVLEGKLKATEVCPRLVPLYIPTCKKCKPCHDVPVKSRSQRHAVVVRRETIDGLALLMWVHAFQIDRRADAGLDYCDRQKSGRGSNGRQARISMGILFGRSTR